MGSFLSFFCCCEQKTTKEFRVPSKRYEHISDVLKAQGYDYDNQVLLDKGGNGLIYTITKLNDRRNLLALKVILLEDSERQRDPKRYETFKNEIFVISQIHHKNVISLFDHFIINQTCYLFLEYANGGDVHKEVERKGMFPEEKTKKYFLQMVRGVEQLTNYKITHRDLKLNNFLIQNQNEEKIIKIADFGFSRSLEQNSGKLFRTRTAVGTPEYMSPEMIKLYIYDHSIDKKAMEQIGKVKTVNPMKADIWALGVCLFYMLSADLPFDFPSRDISVFVDVYKNQMEKNRKTIKQYISSELTDLLNKILEPERADRIDINGVLNHRCIKNVSEIMRSTDLSDMEKK